MDAVEESILGLDLNCDDEELNPAQLAAQQVLQANYDRAVGLVEGWRKSKRKVLSDSSQGIQMFSSPKPIAPKLPQPAPIQLNKVVQQNGPIISSVSGGQGTTRPLMSTGVVNQQQQGTILIPTSSYNQQFQSIVRQTRPIQINNMGGPTRVTQQIVPQTPITIRSTVSTGTTNSLPVQQLIFDANSGLLIMPQQAQQNLTTIRVPNNVNLAGAGARPTTTTRMVFTGTPQPGYTTMAGGIRRPLSVVPNQTPYRVPALTNPSISAATVSALKTYQQTPKIVSTTSVNPGATTATKAFPLQLQQRLQAPAKPPALVASSKPQAQNAAGARPVPTAGGAAANVANGTGSAQTGAENDANNRTFPSLVVSVKPCLHDKPSKAKAGDARSDLDARVKALLIHQPPKFTEWMMQKGLLKLEHKCTVHLNENKEPIPYKLGMYSDGNKQPFSGGYVWISECCADKQVTVFQGSIFEASVYPPGTLLKLIYHWSCQTTAANVLMWVKVTSYYLKNFYTLLRSACVAALHEFAPLMGGKSKFVEVGIITLGTSLAVQNGQKQVKVEILGVFDPTTKVIRMKVINPQNVGVTSASHSRVMQILWPLNHWVDKSSVILIDTSIEKSLLLEMGFKNVHQCKTNAPNTAPKAGNPTNVNVMNYLKHVVPKMFQNTLCVLSKSLIQQFLDELSWRELWGETPGTTFDMMVNHLVQMTKWETGESLISRLNRISLNPFGEWSYSRGRSRTGIEMLPESIRGVGNEMPELSIQAPLTNNKNNGNVASANAGGVQRAKPVNNNASLGAANKPPVLTPQVMAASTMNTYKRKIDTTEIDLNKHYMTEPRTICLQTYYYAQCAGDSLSPLSGEFPNNLKCPLCSKLFISNQEVVRHIFMHVQSMGIRSSSLHTFCEYCLKDVSPVTSLQVHINEVHKMIDIPYACLICQEKFHSETNLTLHMWENHGKSEMPYRCEVCSYKSSFHYEVVSHFVKEHAGTDSVLCPLCLKVLTAKSFTCMKQVVVHLQSHTIRKGKKCGQCTLTFNGDMEHRAHINENCHQSDDLSSTGDRAITFYTGTGCGSEIKMAKPPKVKKIPLQTPMPPLKKIPRLENNNNVGGSAGGGGGNSQSRRPPMSAQLRLQLQGDGTQYNFNELTIQFSNTKTMASKCLECSKLTGNEDHFPGYMVCIKCRFATCCRLSMFNHNLNVHPNAGDIKLKSSFQIKKYEKLPVKIYCGCGFETQSGNRMARHLVSCEKSTAFSEETSFDVGVAVAAAAAPAVPNLLDQLGLTRSN